MHPAAATSYAIPNTHRRPSDAHLMVGKCLSETRLQLKPDFGMIQPCHRWIEAVAGGGSDQNEHIQERRGPVPSELYAGPAALRAVAILGGGDAGQKV